MVRASLSVNRPARRRLPVPSFSIFSWLLLSTCWQKSSTAQNNSSKVMVGMPFFGRGTLKDNSFSERHPSLSITHVNQHIDGDIIGGSWLDEAASMRNMGLRGKRV